MQQTLRFMAAALVALGSAADTLAVTIAAFDPPAGSPSDPTYVQIYGTGFGNPCVVRYNGLQDHTAQATTTTLIQSRLPLGATTGPISVQVGGDITFSTTNFIVIGAGPYISEFAPTSGSDNTVVTVFGAHFGSPYATVTNVSFNGQPGTSINIQSTSRLQVNAPAGVTTGLISVRSSAGGYTNSAYFYVAPAITNFTPASARAGTNIVIRGRNFIGASSVTIGGVSASYTVNSNNQITATVPANAVTGVIGVIAPAGAYYTSSNFVVQPTLLNFTPAIGNVGTNVTINGLNLHGTTAVHFNGNPAFVVTNVSFSTVTAVVPPNTSSGPITITTTNGTAISVDSFYLPPSITGFTPNNTPAGSTIRITGANLTNASSVSFNGTPAASFVVTNNGNIGAVVPAGVITGPISATTPGGIAISAGIFYGPPAIFDFIPTSGLPGTLVTVNGNNFTGASAVRFNGLNGTNLLVLNNNSVRAYVPANATTGPISVVTPAGTNTSAAVFTLDYTSDVGVSVAAAPNPVIVTSNLTYTLVVTNRGPFPAPNVLLTNTLPTNAVLLSATTTLGTLNTNGNPVVGSLGAMTNNASAIVTLTVSPQLVGTATNLVTVRSDNLDPVTANNLATNLVTVIPQPVLNIQYVPMNLVLLSWPVALTNFILQQNTNVTSAAGWTNVLAQPAITNNQRVVTQTNSSPASVYRLKQ